MLPIRRGALLLAHALHASPGMQQQPSFPSLFVYVWVVGVLCILSQHGHGRVHSHCLDPCNVVQMHIGFVSFVGLPLRRLRMVGLCAAAACTMFSPLVYG